MPGLLEVLVLHEADAKRAEEGGADRLLVIGDLSGDGRSPEPRLVERIRAVSSLQVRPLVRLRDGYTTDGGEATRLIGLIGSYLEAGADGVAMGFLNGLGQIDAEVIDALTQDGLWPWTFDSAIDHALDADAAFDDVMHLPRVDQVMTAGSPRGMEAGLDYLVHRCRQDPILAAMVLAGGDLTPEHVPWLARSGVRAFHVSEQVRPQGSWKAYVDVPLVRSWRLLIDETLRRLD